MIYPLSKLYERLSLTAAIGTLGFSLLALLSWYVPSLGLSLFRPVPFLAFFAVGLSLALFHTKGKPAHYAAVAIAAAACLYSATELGYAFGLPIVTEFPLACDSIERINSFCGTLTSSDAAGILILSISLVLFDIKIGRFWRPSESVCAIALVSTIMTLVGMFFGVPSFCMFVSCLKIAFINITIFGAMCIAILFARPADGLIAIMSAESAGGILARHLIPPAILVPLALGAIKNFGQDLGWFSAQTGLTTIIVLLIVLYLVLFGYNARLIDKLDRRNKLLTAQLAQSERRIRATVEQANDPLVTIDSKGMVKQWTPKAVSMFGKTQEQTLGKSVFDFCPEHTREQAQATFAAAIADLSMIPSQPFEFSVCATAGGEIPVEISAFPICIDGEDMVCAFLRDITERKAIQARLNEFYYLVSHELRAPLTSVQGCLDIVLADNDSTLSGSGKNLLQIAEKSCQRLIKLISDLLDVKKIELGKMNLAHEKVDLLDVVSDSVAQFEATLRLRNITCEKIFDTTNYVVGDAERLNQVLTNLLSNAIKFSADHSSIKVKVQSHKPGKVRTSVIDQGAGISDDLKSSLFQKFQQLHTYTPVKQLGSGLGLAIARAIVEEHGGTIGVDSEEGKGSTFWFELPACAQDYNSSSQKGVA